ncbi:MAG TPA: hypothetical protein VL154_16815 [Acetobacteraceae bacterium]|jgi:hypothetical protein|nr:hypothetical protein [Acetobacteraceae bacterium]
MKQLCRAAVLVMFSAVPLKAQPAAPAYVPAFTCQQESLGIRLPRTYPMLRRIAPIRAETVGEVTNWGAYQTVFRDLRFDGLHLQVVTFSNDPQRYMLAGASITDPQWTPEGLLRIGQTLAETRRRLSEFGVALSESLTIGGDGDAVTIRATAGHIVELNYSCYTG